jgi:DNA-binding HxlR family transcriptional regulator
MAKHPVTPFCPRYHYAVELVGRRWTGAIVRMLLGESRRFAELAAAIPDLSDRMLAERLRELEHEGIVNRTVIPATPVRIEYSLTPMGRALEASIRALGEWAEKWLPPDAGQTSHTRAASESPPVKKAPRRAARG